MDDFSNPLLFFFLHIISFVLFCFCFSVFPFRFVNTLHEMLINGKYDAMKVSASSNFFLRTHQMVLH